METLKHIRVKGSDVRIYTPLTITLGIGNKVVYATPNGLGTFYYRVGEVYELIYREEKSTSVVIKNITSDIKRFEDDNF